MVLFNGNPITMTPPNHVELKVEYCEPGVKGDTATNVTKPVQGRDGRRFPRARLHQHRRRDQDRHADRRVRGTRAQLNARDAHSFP